MMNKTFAICVISGIIAVLSYDITTAQFTMAPQVRREAREIYTERPDVANAANTNYVTTTAYSLPAGFAAKDGDTIKIEWIVNVTAQAATKTFKCNIGYSSFDASTGTFTGGNNIASFATALTSTAFWGNTTLRRASATVIDYHSNTFYTGSAAWQGSSTTGNSLTWANANNILCAANDSSGTAGTVTIKWINIYYWPAP